MTPTLPNILPGGNAGAFHEHETAAFPGESGKSGEQFDHVMAEALTPSATRNNPLVAPGANALKSEVGNPNTLLQSIISKSSQQTLPPSATPSLAKNVQTTGLVDDNAVSETSNFLQQPKTSGSSAQKPETNHAKTVTTHLAAQTVSSNNIEIIFAASQPENINIPAPPPAVPFLGSNATLATDISFANEPAGTMPILPETSIASRAASQIPVSVTVDGHSNSKPVSAAKTDVQQKIKTSETSSGAIPAEAASPKIASSSPPILPVPPAIPEDKIVSDLPVKTVADDTAGIKSSQIPDSEPKNLVPMQSGADGTPAAKQGVSMKSAEKTNKIASVSGKNLPGNAAFVTRENNLPVRAEQTAANTAQGFSAQDGSDSTSSLTTSTASSPVIASFASQTMERTHEMVALHAMRLTSTGTNTLQVVIKPDTGTQLSLELRQRGNGIEAQAILQQGDFGHLNQHWAQLQQNLEQRGIRLAPLGSENSFVGNGSGTFQDKQGQRSTETDTAGSFPETVLATLPGVLNTQPAARRGWETWA